MKRLAYIFILLGLSMSALAQSEWVQDKSHSWLRFDAEHIVVLPDMLEEDGFTMGVTEGRFQDYSVKLKQGNPDFSNSELEVVIQVNSIDTENSARDLHLQSADFFDAEQYPLITFRSTEFKRTGDNIFEISGDLTIKDVTKSSTLEARFTGGSPDDTANTYLSFTAEGLIFRNEFGLVWSDLIEMGGFRVSNYVHLKIQSNFIKSERYGSVGN